MTVPDDSETINLFEPLMVSEGLTNLKSDRQEGYLAIGQASRAAFLPAL
jgi:hypothetical protein